jgi:hypothetical protein
VADTSALFTLTPADVETMRAEAKRAKHKAALVGRMVALYGSGPAGATCGQCRHLIGRQFSGKYFKCRFGPQSRGPATDWRARWSACGKFEPRGETP